MSTSLPIYLTKVTFKQYPYQLKIHDVNSLHKFVMSLFPDGISEISPREKGNILWKLDFKNDNLVINVQSEDVPSLDNIKSSYIQNIVGLETKEVSEIYENFLDAGKISYKTRVNPVNQKNNKKIAIRSEDEIFDWWIQKFSLLGFYPEKDALVIEQKTTASAKLGPGANKVQINTADIVGRAQVKDAKLALETIRSGIGKSKSYGYGLLFLGTWK